VLVLHDIFWVEDCHGYVVDTEPVHETVRQIVTTLVVDIAQSLKNLITMLTDLRRHSRNDGAMIVSLHGCIKLTGFLTRKHSHARPQH
jgi:hypothetical protein